MAFFILGLPRSRTAWLANFMSTGDYYCHHDGTNGCKTMEEYKSRLGPYTGDANTALAIMDFRKHFPYAKTVIIDSSIAASVKFGREYFKTDFTEQMLAMKEVLDELDGYHVPFENINDHLHRIWNYLTNNAPYDVRRAEMLKKLEIKVKEPFTIDGPSMLQLMEDLKCQ